MEALNKAYSQEWEIYRVLTSEVKGLPTYLELQTSCNVEDLYNILEMLEAKEEMDDISRIHQEKIMKSKNKT